MINSMIQKKILIIKHLYQNMHITDDSHRKRTKPIELCRDQNLISIHVLNLLHYHLKVKSMTKQYTSVSYRE